VVHFRNRGWGEREDTLGKIFTEMKEDMRGQTTRSSAAALLSEEGECKNEGGRRRLAAKPV
jgi:hypothetical protein